MRTFQVRVEPEWSVTTPKIVKILRRDRLGRLDGRQFGTFVQAVSTCAVMALQRVLGLARPASP